MDTVTLSMLPGFSHLFAEKKITALIACQFTFCVVTTIAITYYIFTRIFQRREKSFHDALRRMKPLKEKIGEIEARRQILNACLDNTEDRCNVHYAFLQCVTRNRLEEGDVRLGDESAKETSKTTIHTKEEHKSGLSVVSALSSLKLHAAKEDGIHPPD